MTYMHVQTTGYSRKWGGEVEVFQPPEKKVSDEESQFLGTAAVSGTETPPAAQIEMIPTPEDN